MNLECNENSMERNQLDNKRDKKSNSKLQQQEAETSKRFGRQPMKMNKFLCSTE